MGPVFGKLASKLWSSWISFLCAKIVSVWGNITAAVLLFLDDGAWDSAQFAVVGAAFGCHLMYKSTDWASYEKRASKQYSSMASAFSSCPGFHGERTRSCKLKQTLSQQVAFSHDVWSQQLTPASKAWNGRQVSWTKSNWQAEPSGMHAWHSETDSERSGVSDPFNNICPVGKNKVWRHLLMNTLNME